MAETICRTLRDGGLEGEHAPALTIKDSIASPFGFDVFTQVLTQLSNYVLAGKSQSRGLVIVAFCRSPSFYMDLLKKRGIDVTSSHKWIQILDGYTDPLGWKDRLNVKDLSQEASTLSSSCKDVRNLDKLYSSITEMGKGLVGQGKDRFSVAIDSVSEMLRHASLSSVAGVLSNLRSNDLHEVRVTAALEYLSSIVASLEPFNRSTIGQRGDLENLSFLEQNFKKGKFNVRFKRRNGRVRVMSEEFHVELSGVNFISVASEDEIISQRLLPKVQFNLQLSEEERTERAKVVLPFEHQGNGEPIQIYDGRKSLNEKREETLASTGRLQTDEDYSEGQIIYYRDSDDEMPDSDEDPDDDLDI